MSILNKIQTDIKKRNYYLSSHAEEEMLDDDLDRNDVENAIRKGRLEKKMTRDARGTRYRIEGPGPGRQIDSCIVPFQRKCESYHHNRICFIGDLMRCEFCDGETIKKRVKRHHWFKKRLYIVENVDAEVCIECGEKYFHAKTLDAIDKFLSDDHPVKDRMEVEIVSLDPAAA